MRQPRLISPVVFAFGALLVPLLAACSGGGSSSDADASAADRYNFASFALDAGRSDVCTVEWGERRLDPVEMLVHGSQDGEVSGDPLPFTHLIPHPYLVDESGRLTWLPADGTALQGASSSDGDVIGMVTASEGRVPGMTALVRQMTGAHAADLEGEYHLAAYLYTPLHGVWRGRATIDGAGGMQCWIAPNIGSVGDGPISDEPLTSVYTVEEDGRIECTFPWSDGVADTWRGHGGVLAGGELIVIAFGGRGVVGARVPAVLMLVRKSDPIEKGFSPVLEGPYRFVAVRGTHGRSSAEDRFAAMTGSVTADLGEMLTWHDTIVNEDGTVDTVSGDTRRKCRVDEAGHMTAQSAAELDLEGGLSPSGRFAVLTGGKRTFDPMVLYLLFRQSTGPALRPVRR